MDIIAHIEQALGCHMCGKSLESSVSDTFCGEVCQGRWSARAVLATPEPIREHVTEADMAGFAEAARRAAESTARLAGSLREDPA